MGSTVIVTGMVLSAMPVGEYDKRLVLLTKERGKLSVFAKGIRRSNSHLLPAGNPFVFGTFQLYAGRRSYNLQYVKARSYFTELAKKQPEIYYGFYFLELADYYGQENADEGGMLNLLYLTFHALMNDHIDNHLIRRIFELRTLVIQGEYPQLRVCASCGGTEGLSVFSWNRHGMLCKKCKDQAQDGEELEESAVYALQYTAFAPLKKLYTFAVTPNIQRQLDQIVGGLMEQALDRKMKSQGILEVMSS